MHSSDIGSEVTTTEVVTLEVALDRMIATVPLARLVVPRAWVMTAMALELRAVYAREVETTMV